MTILSDAGTVVPPLVYVPTQRVRPDDTETTLELRTLQDGQLALMAYTSLDRLVDACGEFQPWALVPVQQVEQIRAVAGFDVVALDVAIPPELRHGRETKDAADRTEGGA